MSKIVKGIMTEGNIIAQIDYQSLANLPTVDSVPTENSTNAVQSGAVYTALAGKLDASDGKAADSILFGGQAPEYYATAEKVHNIEEALGLNAEGDAQASEVIGGIKEDIDALEAKFNQAGQALDAEKFGGELPDYYATKEEVNNAQLTADKANNLAEKATTALAGCWIEFIDENGEPTDEPYIHWYVEEE